MASRYSIGRLASILFDLELAEDAANSQAEYKGPEIIEVIVESHEDVKYLKECEAAGIEPELVEIGEYDPTLPLRVTSWMVRHSEEAI